MSLFGVPDAEELWFSVEEAFDSQIAWWIGEGEDDLSDLPIATIEEWSVLPPIHHVPSSDRIIAWISDTIADEGELSDPHGADAFDESLRQPDVVDVIERLRHLIANRVTWRQAGVLVAKWTVTLDANGEPEFSRKPIERSEG